MTFFRIPCFISCLKYYDFKTSSCTLSSCISCIIIPFTRSLANAFTLRDFWGESIVFWFDYSSINSYSTAYLTLFASEPPPRTFYIRISKFPTISLVCCGAGADWLVCNICNTQLLCSQVIRNNQVINVSVSSSSLDQPFCSAWIELFYESNYNYLKFKRNQEYYS